MLRRTGFCRWNLLRFRSGARSEAFFLGAVRSFALLSILRQSASRFPFVTPARRPKGAAGLWGVWGTQQRRTDAGPTHKKIRYFQATDATDATPPTQEPTNNLFNDLVCLHFHRRSNDLTIVVFNRDNPAGFSARSGSAILRHLDLPASEQPLHRALEVAPVETLPVGALGENLGR